MKKENEIRVTRNYSFWKHPIKYFRDRKKIALLDLYVNSLWKKGLDKEVAEMEMDIFQYGTAIMKDGHRVDPTKFNP